MPKPTAKSLPKKPPRKGDKVSWTSSQGEVAGTVVGQVTGSARVKGHVAKASPAAPEIEVRSDKTGATAIHKPSALKKAR
jgi:hypothetical protein